MPFWLWWIELHDLLRGRKPHQRFYSIRGFWNSDWKSFRHTLSVTKTCAKQESPSSWKCNGYFPLPMIRLFLLCPCLHRGKEWLVWEWRIGCPVYWENVFPHEYRCFQQNNWFPEISLRIRDRIYKSLIPQHILLEINLKYWVIIYYPVFCHVRRFT